MIKPLVSTILGAFLVMGSLWQIEISILNDFHGWSFGYLFTWIQGVNNWAARDFFYMLLLAGFIVGCAGSYYLGKYAQRLETTK